MATNAARNTARDAASERNFRLDMLPNDLAGKVRELSAYDFESGEAQQRFEQLMEKLKQELMQQMVDKMSVADAEHDPRRHGPHEGHDGRRSTS